MPLHSLTSALTLGVALFALPTTDAEAGFVGPWAPTAANGFAAATTGSGTFTVAVSADGSTLTANIANAGDPNFRSFFLENYGYQQTPAVLLPQGPVSYDWKIQYFSPSGKVSSFTDFGTDAIYTDGEIVTGQVSTFYTGGYFGYFGVNIGGFDGSAFFPDASAVITLTNLRVPEPASLLLVGIALAGLGLVRRRSAQARPA